MPKARFQPITSRVENHTIAQRRAPPDVLQNVMHLCLLDRDGVVVVNRPLNIKRPEQLVLIEGAAEAIRRLNQAGVTVAICTNQPEVGRGAFSRQQLDIVHEALCGLLKARGAVVDRVFACTSALKCPLKKPAAGLLREALAAYGVRAVDTPFVGDQTTDLKAAFHAGCPRFLVKTGLGAKALAGGLPAYVAPVSVHPDLAAAVQKILQMMP